MNIFKRNTTLAAASLLGLAFAGTAMAINTSPQSTSFVVSTSVPSTCSINSAGALTFPNYDVLNASSDTATSQISVSCSKGTQITVALSAGSGTFGTRTMVDGSSNTLNYNLYTGSVVTAACTGGTIWGDGTGGSVAQTPAASSSKGTPILLTVNGCIPAGQDAVAGASENYSDTINVTVTFT